MYQTSSAALAGEITVARFWARVDRTETCWLWTGKPEAHGYGRLSIGRVDGKPVRMQAHRFAYELTVGPVPDGMVLDHLCRVRLCVNPEHLEPVTVQENNRRGLARILNRENHQTAKTHCPQGHPYDEANTYVDPDGGRRCRACHRERMRHRGAGLAGYVPDQGYCASW